MNRMHTAPQSLPSEFREEGPYPYITKSLSATIPNRRSRKTVPNYSWNLSPADYVPKPQKNVLPMHISREDLDQLSEMYSRYPDFKHRQHRTRSQSPQRKEDKANKRSSSEPPLSDYKKQLPEIVITQHLSTVEDKDEYEKQLDELLELYTIR